MSRVRFETDRAVLDAFPTARDHVRTPPAGQPPLAFLKLLVARGALEDAVAFCAYLLPRREAVAWGCRSLRQLADPAMPIETEAYKAAQAWVAAPDEDHRLAALDACEATDPNEPTKWLAMAAAHSGGNLAPRSDIHVPTPPHLTASALRVALLLMRTRVPLTWAERIRPCIEAGARIAEFGL